MAVRLRCTAARMRCRLGSLCDGVWMRFSTRLEAISTRPSVRTDCRLSRCRGCRPAFRQGRTRPIPAGAAGRAMRGSGATLGPSGPRDVGRRSGRDFRLRRLDRHRTEYPGLSDRRRGMSGQDPRQGCRPLAKTGGVGTGLLFPTPLQDFGTERLLWGASRHLDPWRSRPFGLADRDNRQEPRRYRRMTDSGRAVHH